MVGIAGSFHNPILIGDRRDRIDSRMDLINSQFNDAQIFTGFKVMENYQNQMVSKDWVQALKNKQFNFRTDPSLQ